MARQGTGKPAGPDSLIDVFGFYCEYNGQALKVL